MNYGALILTLAAAAVHAQEAAKDAPLPNPHAGDTWTYRTIDLFSGAEVDRFSLEFIGRSSDRLIMKATNLQTNSSHRVRPTPDLGRCSRAKDIPEVSCGSPLHFPLRVGERSSYEHLPNANDYGYTGAECKVEDAERITVPAGSFDSFHVECNGRWISNGGELDGILQGKIHDSYWYAPSINQKVKSIFRAWGFKGGPFLLRQEELVAFTAGVPTWTSQVPDVPNTVAEPGSAPSH